MKASGIISALVFAHVAFAQGESSTSATRTGTKSSSTSTSVSDSSAAATPIAISENQTSSNGNPLVPSSASSACTTFLNSFNTDSSMSSCFGPLLTALAAFDPTTGSASSSASATTIIKTLNTFCSSTSCSPVTVRNKLTEFKDACGDELTGASPNTVIIKNYDVLYTLIPFKDAICARDVSTQAYCALNVASSSSTAGNSTQNIVLSSELTASRRKRAQTVLVPNTDAYRSNNLMYLFTSPDMNAGQLCTSCTQQIVSKYIAFESSTPYALGLKNSPLLSGQSALWAAMQEKCPASFLTEVSNIAGVASAADINGASALGGGSLLTALAGALAAGLTLV
ncbi:transmembrane protein [Ceratobasidium theobromae]|uniref:Transmembrane protein n=1 Tax=Ceratobasidium theobromae TaxID=1582974 RepID=A0A5N5QU12_9AGAM|nr:transmembrane protein [Ceratobasidium theobromae]